MRRRDRIHRLKLDGCILVCRGVEKGLGSREADFQESVA